MSPCSALPLQAFKRRPWLSVWPMAVLVLVVSLQTSQALATDTALSSSDRLRRFMAQLPTHPADSPSAGVSPDRLEERGELLKTAEAALARRDVHAALETFERAAAILHAADTEIGIVRTYMQGGDYRRALAFGAHTAGSHLDVMGGAALYAWLLHLGGQAAVAQRLLTASESRLPGHPMIVAVQQQLQSGHPVASGTLLMLPTRLAPYGGVGGVSSATAAKGLPNTARVTGNALLLQDGKSALMPSSQLPSSGKLWLRNGLGQLVKATLAQRLGALNVALVRLDDPLPIAENLLLAAGDTAAGSTRFAVEYVSTPDAAPAWPVLHLGFSGHTKNAAGERLLGIDMPAGPRGGAVFDGYGRLMGLALKGTAGSVGKAAADEDKLVSVSQLRNTLDEEVANALLSVQETPDPTGPKPHGLVEKIYENSLKISLQVITAP